MVRVFAGPNNFGLKLALNEVVADFVKQYDELAVEKLDGEETDFEQIQAAIETTSFLSNKKMVILRNLSTNKQASEQIDDIIAKTSDSTELIIVESKPNKRSSYYKKIAKLEGFQEFKELQEQDMAKWLAGEAKKMDASLGLGDASYLVELVGTNQQALSNELKKLASYDSTITRKNIELLVEANPQSTIFNLLDSAFAGNTKKTLKLYEEQRASGSEPLKIIGMLVWQVHLIALVDLAKGVSDKEIMDLSGVKPYSLQKSRSILRRLGSSGIKNLLARLVQIEKQIKTTSADADNMLKNLLVTI